MQEAIAIVGFIGAGVAFIVAFNLLAAYAERRYARKAETTHEKIVAALRRHVYREHQLRPWAALEVYESTGEDLALVLAVCDEFAANCRHAA